MGMYINENSKGQPLPTIGKANALLEDGAKETTAEFQENLICVVSNEYFDAASYIYSEKEFEAFTQPGDHRPKRWLIYSKAKELAQ